MAVVVAWVLVAVIVLIGLIIISDLYDGFDVFICLVAMAVISGFTLWGGYSIDAVNSRPPQTAATPPEEKPAEKPVAPQQAVVGDVIENDDVVLPAKQWHCSHETDQVCDEYTKDTYRGGEQ